MLRLTLIYVTIVNFSNSHDTSYLMSDSVHHITSHSTRFFVCSHNHFAINIILALALEPTTNRYKIKTPPQTETDERILINCLSGNF